MKKIIAIVLVLIMALSLCACGEKERYPELADMLDAGDYEGAFQFIYGMYEDEQLNGEGNGEGEGEGNGEGNGEATHPTHTEPPRPTEEEYAVLRAYYNIYRDLYNYLEEDYISYWDDEAETSYNGSAALMRYYEQLEALDTAVIDKWKDTEYCDKDHYSYNEEALNWDYNALKACFSKLENVLLQEKITTMDNMENVTENYGSPKYFYNPDGSISSIDYQDNAFEMIESNPWRLSGTIVVETEENGKPTKVKYMSGDSVRYLVTITYDASGNKISEHIKENSGELDITYEYDKQNRLVKIELPNYIGSDNINTYTYTYDDNGNVVKEVIEQHYYYEHYDTEVTNYKYIREFTYDANGVLTSGSYKSENWSYTTEYVNSEWVFKQYVYTEKIDQYSFTADDQGRVQSMYTTFGDTIYVSGDYAGQIYDDADYVSQTVEFVYGDYWFFSAE